jgi:hypothetical protein
MNNKNDKSDIYELVLEKLILRKMREQNEQVSKSLDSLNQIIQTSVLSTNTNSNGNGSGNPKRNGNGKSIIDAMEKKYSKYSSLEDFYSNMRLEGPNTAMPSLYENHTYTETQVPKTLSSKRDDSN